MFNEIKNKQEALAVLCRKRHVRHLAVFGSAIRDDFDPARSDIDFRVEFAEVPAGRYALAVTDIEEFTKNKPSAGYTSDPILQAAAERKFIIVGERLRRWSNTSRETGRASPMCGASWHFAICWFTSMTLWTLKKSSIPSTVRCSC